MSNINSSEVVTAIQKLEETLLLCYNNSSSNTESMADAFRDMSNVTQNKTTGITGHGIPFIEPIPPGSPAGSSGKVSVYIHVVFLKLGEIDTIKEHYAADIFLVAKWREPKLDGKDGQDIELDNFWKPKLYISNVLGDPKETVWCVPEFGPAGEGYILEKRRTKGMFMENMELLDFPFDTQELSIIVTSERSEAELEILENPDTVSHVNKQSFVDEQEWQLHAHVEMCPKVTTSEYSNTKFKHPSLLVQCRADRRPGFFLWNVLLVVFFICSLALTTFSVPFSLVQNRLQLGFILLLSLVAFKFTVANNLPKISYLTYLDKYIIASMTFLFVTCIWHAGVFGMHNLTSKHNGDMKSTNVTVAAAAEQDHDKTWTQVDDIGFYSYGAIYAITHLISGLIIFVAVYKSKQENDAKDKRHEEKAKKIEYSKLKKEMTSVSMSAKARVSPMK